MRESTHRNGCSRQPANDMLSQALQIMIYARAVEGSKEAAKFLNPDHPAKAHNLALSIMEKKLETYRRFNETYPGFGGHIPWVTTSSSDISPTPDWVGRVPALDNGWVRRCIHWGNVG